MNSHEFHNKTLIIVKIYIILYISAIYITDLTFSTSLLKAMTQTDCVSPLTYANRGARLQRLVITKTTTSATVAHSYISTNPQHYGP